MLRISHAIENTSFRLALVPFITVGYPNLDITEKVINLLDNQGVHAIELGIPYSDALADGVVIQESSQIALEQNIYVDQVISLLKDLSPSINTPMIIFTYLNPILSQGIETFVRKISQAGAKGLVVPDLPLEESDYLIAVCDYYNIELILFISPSSSENRIREIVLKAPGCIYLVSSYGVTGLRNHVKEYVQDLVKKIKDNSSKIIMLGFGISNEKQVAEIIGMDLDIDAVVMGTAFINQIKYSYNNDSYENINVFCEKLKNVISLNSI